MMLSRDAIVIGATSFTTVGCCVLFFKELRLTCFDRAFARVRGFHTLIYDLLLMGLVMLVVVVGLQAVGVVLVIAVLIIPAAAARFWTNHTGPMAALAGLIGGLGGWIGTLLSALAPRLPAGAMVVLALAGIFTVSLLFGRRRGIVHRTMAQRRARLNMARDHALRAVWEELERTGTEECLASNLGFQRSWGTLRTVKTLAGQGLLQRRTEAGVVRIGFTPQGRRLAMDVVRRHRLWEHYLIRRANYDVDHVDRGADELEHLLPAELLRELEADLQASGETLPPSPHALDPRGASGAGA